MAENTAISWCDHTFNPWIGCTKVSPGCDNCYAEKRMDSRLHVVNWGVGQPRKRTSVKNWGDPKKWNKQHAAFFAQHGRRQRVFCASLADVFDNEVSNTLRSELLGLIYRTPNLDWLLLTKRIGNVPRLMQECTEPGKAWELPPNVWLGATVVNQEEADRDIPKLLQVPARVRFLSMEPLLGAVNLADISDGHADSTIAREYWTDMDTADSPPAVGHNALTGERWQRFGDWCERGPSVDWVIVGGESGPGARPMHPDWARSLRDQCAAAGVPFHFKQWGEFVSVSEVAGPGAHFYFPDGATVRRIGKKTAGRSLDGVTHDDFPAQEQP